MWAWGHNVKKCAELTFQPCQIKVSLSDRWNYFLIFYFHSVYQTLIVCRYSSPHQQEDKRPKRKNLSRTVLCCLHLNPAFADSALDTRGCVQLFCSRTLSASQHPFFSIPLDFCHVLSTTQMASLPASLFGIFLVTPVKYLHIYTLGHKDVLSFTTLCPVSPPFARWPRCPFPCQGLNLSWIWSVQLLVFQ